MSAHVAPYPDAPATATEPVAGNYFVAVYPPFSAWNEASVPALESALEQANGSPVGLYVHLPFCAHKCDYCYYVSYVGESAANINAYLSHVRLELRHYSSHRAMAGRPLAFVYFGGGTPSALGSGQIQPLMEGLKKVWPWEGVKEVTFECAPRSVRTGLLATLKAHGITRLSMGVQSFDDAVLKFNGRIHLAADVYRAFALIQEFGFNCVNLDLMTGLVGESWAHWEQTVRSAIGMGPDSITIYQLEIPYYTPLYRDWKAGRLISPPPTWEEKRERLAYAFTELEAAGYHVINPYMAVRDPARHRFFYQDHLWRGGDMLGLGVASFGYVNGVHYQNFAGLPEYTKAVEQGTLPVQRAKALSPAERLVREFIFALKLGRVDLPALNAKFKVDAAALFQVPLRDLTRRGYLRCSDTDVTLTRAGLLRADRLVREFFQDHYREVRYT